MPIPSAQFVESSIREATGNGFELRELQPVAGGSIHACFLAKAQADQYFVKLGGPECADMFAAEADGLDALRDASPFVIPAVIARANDEAHACLVLESLEISPLTSPVDGTRAGEALAILHTHRHTQFGWHRSNFLGRTALDNTFHAQWASFLHHARFTPLLDAAADAGFVEVARRGRKFVERLPALFVADQPPAARLHGDLWHGNIGVLEDGRPVIFDPATFYGDPLFDLAMTALFGGFPTSFYTAYRQTHPPVPEQEARERVYRCYHLLNHLVLFGRSYERETLRLLDWLIGYR